MGARHPQSGRLTSSLGSWVTAGREPARAYGEGLARRRWLNPTLIRQPAFLATFRRDANQASPPPKDWKAYGLDPALPRLPLQPDTGRVRGTWDRTSIRACLASRSARPLLRPPSTSERESSLISGPAPVG